ncbi:hypothetical protein K7432_008457 [Basidiobolus ranarum]|uniref:Uncharacterized protein n=1 Tax=Basidiobolus ranarum TaxID=34480 RepID=A0ABR2VYR6_9FUNG
MLSSLLLILKATKISGTIPNEGMEILEASIPSNDASTDYNSILRELFETLSQELIPQPCDILDSQLEREFPERYFITRSRGRHSYPWKRFRQQGRAIINQAIDGRTTVHERLPLSKSYLRSPSTHFKHPKHLSQEKTEKSTFKDKMLLSKSRIVRERSNSAWSGKGLHVL